MTSCSYSQMIAEMLKKEEEKVRLLDWVESWKNKEMRKEGSSDTRIQEVILWPMVVPTPDFWNKVCFPKSLSKNQTGLPDKEWASGRARSVNVGRESGEAPCHSILPACLAIPWRGTTWNVCVWGEWGRYPKMWGTCPLLPAQSFATRGVTTVNPLGHPMACCKELQLRGMNNYSLMLCLCVQWLYLFLCPSPQLFWIIYHLGET